MFRKGKYRERETDIKYISGCLGLGVELGSDYKLAQGVLWGGGRKCSKTGLWVTVSQLYKFPKNH